MKKVIVGLVAVGALIALRPVVKRRVLAKMHEHCKQMAAHCREMMGAQRGGPAESTGQEAPLAARQEDRGEAVATA
jgi:hypothetical protein